MLARYARVPFTSQARVRQKFGNAISPQETEAPLPGPSSIDLIEALSHQALTEGLERLSRRDWRIVAARPPARTSTHQRRKFGTVGDAVIHVLTEAEDDLRTVDIRLGVEQLLDGNVATSSVKNYLKRGCKRQTLLFKRVGAGRYRLIR